MSMKFFLLALLSVSALIFAVTYIKDAIKRRKFHSKASWAPLIGIGFITNFFDTLGIGSFAPTTSFYKFTKLVDDRVIPGTLNVGHCLPVITQALIFITVVQVAPFTLISMMFAATLGAVIGAGVVSKMPVNKIRVGLGAALLLVAFAMLAGITNIFPSGGDAFGLNGWKLAVAIGVIFLLGRAPDHRHRAVRALYGPRLHPRHESSGGIPDYDGGMRPAHALGQLEVYQGSLL